MAKELLLAGMGTAFEASGIEVDHHAADFAAGGRTGGHGIRREGPLRQPIGQLSCAADPAEEVYSNNRLSRAAGQQKARRCGAAGREGP